MVQQHHRATLDAVRLDVCLVVFFINYRTVGEINNDDDKKKSHSNLPQLV